MRALLAHPGTQYAAQLARQLYCHGRLLRFWTGFGLAQRSWVTRLLEDISPVQPVWLGNRVITGLPAAKLRTLPTVEFAQLVQRRLGGDSRRLLKARNEKFQRAIPVTEIQSSDLVIGFDTSSEILADRAAACDRPFILDQTIAHPRSKAEAYKIVRAQFPEWSDDLDDVEPSTMTIEETEQQNATHIVVASSFTKRTLIDNGVPQGKIALNPYGVDLDRFRSDVARPTNRPLRFLFAGLVSARKGVPLLLQAWTAIRPSDAELWIAGPMTDVAARQRLEKRGVKILGKVSNAELARIMSECDIFVFPSYFEGFGLVLLEAMASGLPVITTTATAGSDIVTDGREGWVLEPGNIDGLVAKMRHCIINRGALAAMGANARETAERFSWDAYGDRWSAIIDDVCRG